MLKECSLIWSQQKKPGDLWICTLHEHSLVSFSFVGARRPQWIDISYLMKEQIAMTSSCDWPQNIQLSMRKQGRQDANCTMHKDKRRKERIDVLKKLWLVALEAIKTHNACLHLTSLFFWHQSSLRPILISPKQPQRMSFIVMWQVWASHTIMHSYLPCTKFTTCPWVYDVRVLMCDCCLPNWWPSHGIVWSINQMRWCLGYLSDWILVGNVSWDDRSVADNNSVAPVVVAA